jgi:hypothetical protein
MKLLPLHQAVHIDNRAWPVVVVVIVVTVMVILLPFSQLSCVYTGRQVNLSPFCGKLFFY